MFVCFLGILRFLDCSWKIITVILSISAIAGIIGITKVLKNKDFDPFYFKDQEKISNKQFQGLYLIFSGNFLLMLCIITEKAEKTRNLEYNILIILFLIFFIFLMAIFMALAYERYRKNEVSNKKMWIIFISLFALITGIVFL